jgi:PAS domain S-box-containing protein
LVEGVVIANLAIFLLLYRFKTLLFDRSLELLSPTIQYYGVAMLIALALLMLVVITLVLVLNKMGYRRQGDDINFSECFWEKAAEINGTMVLFRKVNGQVVGGNGVYKQLQGLGFKADTLGNDPFAVFADYPINNSLPQGIWDSGNEPFKTIIKSKSEKHIFDVEFKSVYDSQLDLVGYVELVKEHLVDFDLFDQNLDAKLSFESRCELWSKHIAGPNGEIATYHLLESLRGWYRGQYALFWSVGHNENGFTEFLPFSATEGIAGFVGFDIDVTAYLLNDYVSFPQIVVKAMQLSAPIAISAATLIDAPKPFDAEWVGDAVFVALRDVNEQFLGIALVLGGRLPLPVESHSDKLFRNQMGQLFAFAILHEENAMHTQNLLERKLHLERTLFNLPGMVFVAKNNSRFDMDFVSNGCYELTGYSAGELKGSNTIAFGDLIKEEDKINVWREIQRCILINQTFQVNYRIKTKNNKEKWVWQKGNFYGFHSDGTMLIEGLLIDISAQVKAQTQVAEQELFLNKIVATMPYFVLRFDKNGNILPTYFKLWPFGDSTAKAEDYIGKHFSGLFNGQTAQVIALHLAQLRQTGNPVHFEYEYFMLGKRLWHEARMVLTKNDEVLLFSADITDRKDTEARLALSESLFRAHFDMGNIAIAILEVDLSFSMVNQTLADLLGYGADELNQASWANIMVPEDLDYDRYHFDKLLSGALVNYQGDRKLVHKDGRIVHAHFSVVMFSNKFLEFRKFIASFVDISDRMGVERKVLNAIIETEERERMRVARDIHDGLGPILSSVKMYVQWLKMADSKANKADVLNDVEVLINHAHQTVREISFNLSPHVLQNYGLVAAVKSYINKVSEVGPLKIGFEDQGITERLGEDIEVVLYRSITECLTNTVKYASANNVCINLSKSDSLIEVDFMDDGVGFDVAGTLDQKKGLGLFNMQSRLKAVGGTVDFVSGAGLGTTVKMRIQILNK